MGDGFAAAVGEREGKRRRNIGDGEFRPIAGRQCIAGVESHCVSDGGTIVNDEAIILVRKVYPRLHQGNTGRIQGKRALTGRGGGDRPDHCCPPIRGALSTRNLPVKPRPVTIPV